MKEKISIKTINARRERAGKTAWCQKEAEFKNFLDEKWNLGYGQSRQPFCVAQATPSMFGY